VHEGCLRSKSYRQDDHQSKVQHRMKDQLHRLNPANLPND
jgi:hypothetical protein